MNTQTKTSVVGWFNQRGMEPLDYQPMAIITTIRSEKKKVVLAAAPNSGKTTMSICIIDLLKEINPDMKVLILTHNQVILRKNFSESIEDLGRPFDYQVIEDCNDPITKRYCYWYPRRFKSGNSADVYTEISTSTYFMDQKDYNTDGEVNKSYNFGKNETIVTLDDVMSKVYNRLVSKMRQPKNYAYSPLVDWVFLNKNMGRTMIACRNQSQAKKVGDYFTSKGIKNIVSISDSDSDNELLRAWEQKQEYRVLIVVRRGILGFSDETLVNLVDMTMSKNINRMFQLYNRVTRKFGDTKKLYIKVVPANLSDYHSVFVAGMLSMLHEEWYTKFNGKNFYEMRIPIKKNTTKRNGGTGISKSTTKVKLRIEDLGCIQPQEMFQYLNSNKSKLLNPEYWVDMRTVMIKLDEHYSNGKTTWNLSEKIVDENYSQFENKTLSELESTYQGSVTRARKFGYHNELLEKYNITKDYYKRNPEDRAQIIIDFCKKNNITKRHELRNHSQEGQKHYAWVKKHSEIGDKILPRTTIKWTVESVLQTEKEAKEKKIGFKTYSASAWGAKRRLIKQGLIQ
jgi:hypothetical protein